MRHFPALAIVVASTALIAACSSTKLNDAKVEDKPMVSDNAPKTDQRSVEPMTTGSTDDLKTNPALASRSVYFDFDSYIVKDEGKPVITAHSKYLASKKDRKILIQGNTDERGGSEYNLALGQKRAEAVRKSMAALGVSDGQMEATSLGKEKPKALGHDEADWAQNRRADIVY